MQRFRVVYHGIFHASLVFFWYTNEPLPCHRKYSGQHNQWDIRADFILNGFQLAFNRSWSFVSTAVQNTFKIVFYGTKYKSACQINLGGNKIRNARWESWVEDTVEYTTAFLNSDWLYFLWRAINKVIVSYSRSTRQIWHLHL